MAQTVGTSQATPDADLIAACADYLRIQRAWSAYCESLDGDVEKNDPNDVERTGCKGSSLMAALSKRAQLELQGWKFTPVPRFVHEGLLSDSRTGWRSQAFYDHKDPEAWIAAPPSSLQIDERGLSTEALTWRYAGLGSRPTCRGPIPRSHR